MEAKTADFFHCQECDMIVRHLLNNEGKYVCQNCGHTTDPGGEQK